MTGQWFLNSEQGKRFIQSNLTMQHFLSRVPSPESQERYAHSVFQYCKWANKSPDELIAERKTTDGYPDLDRLQSFILTGQLESVRTYPSGRVSKRTIKLGESSKAHRALIYNAVKSFYAYNRAALPAEKFRITENHTVDNAIRPKTSYMSLEQGNAMIMACKSPYRELFSAMKYGGLGRREVLLINALWPRLKEEMRGKDLDTHILELDYNYRKEQEDAYCTFIPAKLLAPFIDEPMPFMVKGKPMSAFHIHFAWLYAKRRAGIKDNIKPHMYRDLMITDGFVNAKIPQEYLQFMTGHSVDKNLYLQLSKKPEQVLTEWRKWQSYVDGTLADRATQQKLEIQGTEIGALAEQNKMLRENMIAMLIEERENLGDEAASVLNGLDYMKREKKPKDYKDEHYRMNREDLEGYLSHLNEQYLELTKRLKQLGYVETVQAKAPD
jgi:hypothetical protein